MGSFELIGPTANQDAADILTLRAQRLAPFIKRHADFAPDYIATAPLRTAVNVALSLGRPLLLTGEPGSGKTLAAWWIAHRLGLSEEHIREFHVKSDSRARDLCYEFDAVSWYRESQLRAARQEQGEVPKSGFLRPGPLGDAFGWNGAKPDKPFVILIDEIDKAPRDFPNDLLLELDQMKFLISETNQYIECPPDLRPVIVITSNAERRLPDPFLRRCVVHNIVLDGEVVPEILRKRLAEVGSSDDALIKAAADFWLSLANKSLTRKPTIDEYWRWLVLAVRFGEQSTGELAEALHVHDNARKLPYIESLFLLRDLEIAMAGDRL